ncbi:MAG TPA: Na/Pi cotransporter family protein [Steroidobacteraceae bacterium]|jgi:phosphate:Na+ symporter
MTGSLALVELAGHVGLLLWGTHMVSSGVQRGFGQTLRHFLGRNLGARLRAFITGLGITVLMQSSTATGLLATSFTASGLIGLAPALAVMLGANVGTAALCELFALNTAYIGPPLVLLGVLFFRWSSDGRTKNIGRIAIGLGLMLMALGGLVHTLSGIESAPLLKPALRGLSNDPVLAILVAALVTWACHSSIAMVLLVASFAASGVIELPGALALVLGANLGGALPPLVSATTPAARRLPVGNLLVRATGVLLAAGFVGPLSDLIERYDADPGRRVVDFHVLFNVCLALAFLLSVENFAKLLTRLLPEAPPAANPATPLYLDQAGLSSGTVALANASRETLRMADMVTQMLQRLPEVVVNESRGAAPEIVANGRSVDLLGDSIRLYLADIGDEQNVDTDSEGARAQDILSAVINLEHIADIVCNGMMDYSIRSLKAGQRLAVEEQELVSAMHRELMESMTLAISIFLQPEPVDARRLVESKGSIRLYESRATALSVKRLRGIVEASRSGGGESAERIAEESGLLLRLVRDLRRVHSHLARFAYPVLHRSTTVRRTRRRRGPRPEPRENPPPRQEEEG